jgi:acetaldehyde dehydrogenase
MDMRRLRVAIIGSGNIGTDLLFKVRRSDRLKCTLMVGRRIESPGLAIAREMGIETSTEGLSGLLDHIESLDLIFDATSAADHLEIASALAGKNIALINLTPAPLGEFFIPLVTRYENGVKHLNMVTCGGQTSIPILFRLAQEFDITEAEVVSTIASSSAGLATRQNLDEYISNTERAIVMTSKIKNVKVMLMINPAVPEIVMHTSIYLRGPNLQEPKLVTCLQAVLKEMASVNPHYKLISPLKPVSLDTYHFAVEVEGSGDYLPKYSGNLDIINLAAIQAAEALAVSGVMEG